jgi:hypothetical protein
LSPLAGFCLNEALAQIRSCPHRHVVGGFHFVGSIGHTGELRVCFHERAHMALDRIKMRVLELAVVIDGIAELRRNVHQ